VAFFYYLKFRQCGLLERSDKNARTGNAPSIASAYTPSMEISVFA